MSNEDMTIGCTGTQFGKSQAGALWVQRQMFTFTDPKDNFIVAAPTYKILNQSIIPYFLFHMGQFGDFNKSDATFKLRNGGTCYFRTETDPDSIVGIPNVKAGWLDEAGKLRLYFFENYMARAAAKGARTLLTSSPYAMNWFWHRYVKPASQGKLKNTKLIRAASWENPFHTLHDPNKRQQIKETMDARRFDMIFGGEFGQMQGLVYDSFDHDQNICEPETLPPGTKYYGGIDWGYTEPFVLTIRAVTPYGDHYQVSEYYKSGLTISDIIKVCKQKKQIFNIQMFYCGPDQPGYIEELNRNGIPAVKADNDIRRGIDAHYELIKSRRYKIFKGNSPFTIDELETYHYPEQEDLGPDDKAKDKGPVQQNDHALDSNRYLSISLVNSVEKKRPVVPEAQLKPTGSEAAQIIKRLQRRQPGGRIEW